MRRIVCRAAHPEPREPHPAIQKNQGPPPAACGHASASPNDGGGEDRSSPLARLLLVPSSTVGGGLGWRTTVRQFSVSPHIPMRREGHPEIQQIKVLHPPRADAASASPNDGGGEDRSSPLARLLLVPSSTVGGGLGWRTTVRQFSVSPHIPMRLRAASRNSANQGPPPAACGHASASPNDGGGEDRFVAVGETTAGSLLHRWRRVRVEDNCAVIFCFAAHSDATSAASRNSANQGPPPAACGHASASPNDGGGEDFRLWQTGYAALTFFCTGGVVSLIRRDTSSSLIVQMRSSAG